MRDLIDCHDSVWIFSSEQFNQPNSLRTPRSWHYHQVSLSANQKPEFVKLTNQKSPWHHLNHVKVTLCTFRKPQMRTLSLIHWEYQHLISCHRANVLISLEKYQFHPELILRRRCEVWWQEDWWRLTSGLWLVKTAWLWPLIGREAADKASLIPG